MSDVDVLYQIANLKNTEYKNLLVINALIDLLIEKKIISQNELFSKVKNLDVKANSEINANIN